MEFPRADENLPFVTKEQMMEVDRILMEDYRFDLLQLMENAGRNLANLARQRFLGGDPRARHVVVLAGTGGNGGGALAAARMLQNYGASVSVYVTKSIKAFSPAAAHQLNLLGRMRVPLTVSGIALPPADADLIIDGLIGYSLDGPPNGEAAKLIDWANNHDAPVLSLDVPSGLNATSGMIRERAVKATATMTLALPKTGLRAHGKNEYIGELYLANIGVPPALYMNPKLSLAVDNVFYQSDIVQVW